MPLKHADIWRAIDRLAEKHGLTPSGLARRAGLSPTIFNPSKRDSRQRKRWPSTESIACILRATGSSLDDFVALASPDGKSSRGQLLPLMSMEQAGRRSAFDETGRPVGKGWDEIRFPDFEDQQAFALEIGGTSMAPVYREGDRLVISPASRPRRGDRVALRTTGGDIFIGTLGRETAQKVDIDLFTPDSPTASFAPDEIEWMHRILWASQ